MPCMECAPHLGFEPLVPLTGFESCFEEPRRVAQCVVVGGRPTWPHFSSLGVTFVDCDSLFRGPCPREGDGEQRRGWAVC